ncbi:MAG: lysostaphin resistance A-like protein [Alphaproteobacteria bacterium]
MFEPKRVTRGNIPAFDIRWWEVLSVLGATLGFALVAASVAILALSGGDPGKIQALARSEIYVLSVLAVSTIGMIASVYFIVILRRGIGWRGFGLKPMRRRAVILSIIAGLLCVPLMAFIGSVVQKLLGRPPVSPQLPFLAPEGFSYTALVGMLVIGGILAPFAEELIFRGLAFGWLRRFWPVWPAALLSAGLFGLVHGLLPIMVAASAVGLVLALAYEKTGSLWSPVIIHATQNSVAIALMFATIA